MANWKYQINLADIFENVEEQPIELTAMEIYQRFASFMENHSEMFEDDYSTEDTIDNLKYCESVEEIVKLRLKKTAITAKTAWSALTATITTVCFIVSV